MATGRAEGDIEASADDVWQLLGDFAGVADVMPGIEKCEIDGDVRVIHTMGVEVREQLISRDDATRTLSYSIVDFPMPLDRHQATITVVPAGARSHVTWDVEVAPDNLLDVFVPIYQQSVDQIVARFA